MSRNKAHAAVLVLALGLAGCFRSAQPLIPAGTADHPFPAGGSYVSQMWGMEHGGWLPAQDEKVEIDGDDYIINFSRMRFKAIGGGYYMIQKQDAEGDPKLTYEYNMLKVESDGSILIYSLQCEPDVDPKFVLSGDIDAIEGFTPLVQCQVSSFDGLAKVFRDRAAGEPQPVQRFERRRGG